MSLPEAIIKYSDLVEKDIKEIEENKDKPPVMPDECSANLLMMAIEIYIDRMKKEEGKKDNLMVRIFDDFIKSEDTSVLKGIAYDIDKGQHSLKYSRLLANENSRYQDTPILILDATADERVFSELLPHFEFNKIRVKKDPLVKIFQCYDRNITLASLTEEITLKHIIVDGLVKVIQQEQVSNSELKVGIISYLNVKGISDDFSQWLGDQIKTALTIEPVVSHFGAERGLNTFKDCDLVFRVGRFNNPTLVKSYARALGWKVETNEMADIPMFAMMADGTFLSWKVWQPCNDSLIAANEIACRSTSIQADGRIRHYYASKPKKLFILSNECLGYEIELDSMFSWNDYFETKSQLLKKNKIEQVIQIDNLPACFKFDKKTLVDEFGLKLSDWNRNQDIVIQILKSKGY